jgi:hypothetical protein
VVDHHVDRPQVEAGQPVQPSGPNRSNAAFAPSPEHAKIRGQRSDDRWQKMTALGSDADAILLTTDD